MPAAFSATQSYLAGSARYFRLQGPHTRHLLWTNRKAVPFPSTGSALCQLVRPTRMASADPSLPIPPPYDGSSTRQVTRYPRVGRTTFIPYARRIYFLIFRVTIGLRILWPPRPDEAASYALRIPRAGTLRTASFRFHLTTDTLAVRLTIPATRVRRGLAPPSVHRGTTPSLEDA